MKVIGAGLGRTGTTSLKLALEQLTGGACYHMFILADRPSDVAVWGAAARGEPVDWKSFLGEFDAAVDWPASAFWEEISQAFPDAIILLSTRDSGETWWQSAAKTIIPTLQEDPPPPERAAQRAMVRDLMARRFTPDWGDETAARSAYEQHNARVRALAPPERLVEWQPGDGWEPIARALGVPVPDEPFPHRNTGAEFRSRVGTQLPPQGG